MATKLVTIEIVLNTPEALGIRISNTITEAKLKRLQVLFDAIRRFRRYTHDNTEFDNNYPIGTGHLKTAGEFCPQDLYPEIKYDLFEEFNKLLDPIKHIFSIQYVYVSKYMPKKRIL